jgi:hypothetical protein
MWNCTSTFVFIDKDKRCKILQLSVCFNVLCTFLELLTCKKHRNVLIDIPMTKVKISLCLNKKHVVKTYG